MFLKIQRYCCLCIWVYQHVQIMLVAGIINYIYGQTFKGVSLEVKQQAQESYRRDDSVSCCGQYQVLHGTAQLFIEVFYYHWWSIKFIIHTWLTLHLILWWEGSPVISPAIETIGFFPNQHHQNAFLLSPYCMGSRETDAFPKHSGSFFVKLFMFPFYLQLKSVKFCEVGKNTRGPACAVFTALGTFRLPRGILGASRWWQAELPACAN